MEQFFHFLFSKISDVYTLLGTFYIFPGVSLLSFLLTLLILTVIFNLLSFFNFDFSTSVNFNEVDPKKGNENKKDKKKQKKNGVYLLLFLLILPLKVEAYVENITSYTDSSSHYSSSDKSLILNYISRMYLGYELNSHGNPYIFHWVIKSPSSDNFILCNSYDIQYNGSTYTLNCNQIVGNFSYNPDTKVFSSGVDTTQYQFFKPNLKTIDISLIFWSDGIPLEYYSTYWTFNQDTYTSISAIYPYGNNIYMGDNPLYGYLYRSLGIVVADFDEIAPTFNLVGAIDYNHEINTIYNDLGYTCFDASGICTVEITGEVDTSKLDTYELEYNACDNSNNCTTATRTVNVIDTTPPILELKGQEKIFLLLNSDWEEPGYTLSDNSLEDIEVEITGEVDTINIGNYDLEYKACDSSNNCTTATRTVIIVEELPLDFTGSQFLFADFEAIKNIFPNLDFSSFKDTEKIIITIVFNIFLTIFIALLIYITLNIIHKFLRVIRG